MPGCMSLEPLLKTNTGACFYSRTRTAALQTGGLGGSNRRRFQKNILRLAFKTGEICGHTKEPEVFKNWRVMWKWGNVEIDETLIRKLSYCHSLLNLPITTFSH